MTYRARTLAIASLLGGLGIAAAALLWPAQPPTPPAPSALPAMSSPSPSPEAYPRLDLLFPPGDHAEKLQKLPIALAARFMRAEDEWQGMVPDPEKIWPCMPDGTCSKARACINELCLPCVGDSECQNGELCVLGHCVRENQVECSTRRDCEGPDALCLLSGYTPLDPRSNLDMRARCQQPSGSVELTQREIEADLALQNAPPQAGQPSQPSAQDRILEQMRAVRPVDPAVEGMAP